MDDKEKFEVIHEDIRGRTTKIRDYLADLPVSSDSDELVDRLRDRAERYTSYPAGSIMTQAANQIAADSVRIVKLEAERDALAAHNTGEE